MRRRGSIADPDAAHTNLPNTRTTAPKGWNMGGSKSCARNNANLAAGAALCQTFRLGAATCSDRA